MKIGILTYHNADNYGAVLQCYALQEILRSWGHEVCVIDYRNQPLEKGYIVYPYSRRSVAKDILNLHPQRAIKAINNVKMRALKRTLFESFREKYLNRTPRTNGANLPQDLDGYIIGSDQMWTLACTSGYDPVYFGEFKRPASSRLIGYAISSNADFVPVLSLNKIEERVNDFTCLAVREQKIAEIVKRLTGREVPVVLDPTLLTDEETWKPLINEKWASRNFVAVYRVDRCVDTTQILRQAQEYASAHSFELVDAGSGSVEDFVSIIKYAQCVFTSSFHAAVFASIFSTPLLCFKLHDGSDDRFVAFLESIGEGCHLCEMTDKIESVPTFTKKLVNERLTIVRNSSIEYLKNALC